MDKLTTDRIISELTDLVEPCPCCTDVLKALGNFSPFGGANGRVRLRGDTGTAAPLSELITCDNCRDRRFVLTRKGAALVALLRELKFWEPLKGEGFAP